MSDEEKQYSTVTVKSNSYPGIFTLLNIKRELIGKKGDLKEAELKFEIGKGSDIFISGDRQMQKLAKRLSKSDLTPFVSPSANTRLKAAVKHRAWKARRLLDAVFNPEDEVVEIDYK